MGRALVKGISAHIKPIPLRSQPLRGVRTQRAAWDLEEGPRWPRGRPGLGRPASRTGSHTSLLLRSRQGSLLPQSGRREALSFMVRPALEPGLLVSNGGNVVIEAAAL